MGVFLCQKKRIAWEKVIHEMKMTVKQQRFADEYIISGNATQAAIKAGYSKKTSHITGHENLKKPNIAQYIEQRLNELKSEKVADQQEVMEYLTAVMRGETTEQTLRGEGEGYQTIDNIDVAAKDRIRAAELIGKRHMMWTDKQQVDGDINLQITVDYGDDDES